MGTNSVLNIGSGISRMLSCGSCRNVRGNVDPRSSNEHNSNQHANSDGASNPLINTNGIELSFVPPSSSGAATGEQVSFKFYDMIWN